MRSPDHGWIGTLMRILAAVGFIYVALPVLMMFPLSVEPGQILRFPPQGVSLHWYTEYLSSAAWLASTMLSLKVAAGASIAATLIGTPAAVRLARTRGRVHDLGMLVLMSPLFLPTIVIAIAIYGVFASLRLVGTPLGLVAAHTVLTLPFVILNVTAAMSSAPRALEEASMSLGASPLRTFLRVTAPLVSRGIAAGAIFSFLVSFDEVVIAMFLSGTQAVTLPKRMLDGIFYEMSPMLAAISVLLVLVNVVLATLALVLSRPRRAEPG